MKTFLWLIEAFLFLVPVLFLGILPKNLSIKIGELLGSCLFYTWSSRKKIALKNIEIAKKGGLNIPSTPHDIVIRHFKNLGRSFAELSMLFCKRYSIARNVEFEGIEHYDKAKAKGRGIIFITGHCGNWELLAFALAWRGFPLSIVVRPLDNPYLNRLIERLRMRFGNKVIYKKGAIKKILMALKKGEDIGILMDQSVAENEAVITEFLGEKVYTTKMPALLSIKTGSSVIPMFINHTGDGKHRIWFGKEIAVNDTGNLEDDVLYNTEVFSKYIEEYIRQHQSEWLWIHRRWKLSHGRKY